MRSPIPTRLIARDEPGKFICRLCFGSPVAQRQVQHSTHSDTILEFVPGQLFGVVWWQRDTEDCQHRALAVLEPALPKESAFALPCLSTEVHVHAMVGQHGPAGQDGAVDRFLDLVEKIRIAGHNPERLPPILYRTLSYEILTDRPIDVKSVLQCLDYRFVSNN